MQPDRLDDAVIAASTYLREADTPQPALLLLLGTGHGTLPASLAATERVSLASVPGVPGIWSEAQILLGEFQGQTLWLLEDAPGDLEFGEGGGPASSPWERAFVIWLAAHMGARLCLLTAGGGSLVEDLPIGSLAVLSDHINLSGTTPLLGLGETTLGPLFPDQSRLHHSGLRAAAKARAKEQGIEVSERVAACVMGPALATPAERRWFASSGAQLFSQGIAGPLIACAHAGLPSVSLIAITDGDDTELDMAELIARAEDCAPRLEDVILALLPQMLEVAEDLAREFA